MDDNSLEKKKFLILGAGPAGLAAAFELQKSSKSFVLVEKNDTVGGLSRTIQYGEFKTDVGPHRFFSQNQYLYDFIEDLLKEHWIPVDRLTRFIIGGKFFLYPVSLKNALLNVGFYRGFKIIFDYSLERLKKLFFKKEIVSFEDQVISDFGRSLAELNMLNYTEKVWGLPCSQISPDWAAQRIKGLSLKEIIKNIFIKSKKGPKTLVDQFYYPDNGAGMLYEKIKDAVLASGMGEIKLNSHPISIIHDGDKIKEVVIENRDGSRISFNPEYLISSIPINEFVNLLSPKVPDEIIQAARELKFRSHVSLFITVKKESIFPDQWIYFPDKEIPFGRIMEPKNFSKKMSPPGKSSLLIEFFCWENDKIWNATKEELFELSIGWLEKFGFIKREEVIDIFIHKEKYAYPVYDLKYKENLKRVKNHLQRFKNLMLIGRSGIFRYNNQDHALEMGILAVKNIIEGKQYNIEEVGSGKDYFERGYIKTRKKFD